MGRALLVMTNDFDRQKAKHWVDNAPVGTRIEFKASKRSLPQNDRLWAMLTDVAAYMKAKGREYTTEEWKLLFMHAWGREVRFLPGLDQKTVVPVGQSSSDLSKEEMTDLIEFIFAWGAENGVTFNEQESSPAGADPAGAGDDRGSAAEAPSPPPAADGTAAADPAGDLEAPPPASEPPADTKLSEEDREFLVRVFTTMRDCVGPSVEDFKRSAMIFKDEIAGKSALVKAKATKIRTELERCCGEDAKVGTVEMGKYLAGIIGVEEKELVNG